jgi:hypothetical protein
MFEARKYDDKRDKNVAGGRTMAERPDLPLFQTGRLARL